MVVTNYFFKSINVPDNRSIPISSEDYINKSKNFTQEQIDKIMFPEVRVWVTFTTGIQILVLQVIQHPPQIHI